MAFTEIGRALETLRRQRGLSQAELADRAQIGRPQVSRYVSGKELMKLATLEKLLRALAIKPDEFFRFLDALDESRTTDDADGIDRVIEDTFRDLHRAIDELRCAVEESVNPTSRTTAYRKIHSSLDALRRVVRLAIDPGVRFSRLIDEAASARNAPARDARRTPIADEDGAQEGRSVKRDR